MNSLFLKFKLFFFFEANRLTLERMRIIFYSACFIYFFNSHEAASFFNLDIKYWNPNGLFSALPFLAPPLEVSTTLEIIWKSSFAFCALGLLTRQMKWVCLFLSIFYIGYSSNFYLYPVENVVAVFCLALLCFCDIGHSWALENYFRNKVSDFKKIQAWPIRFIQFLLISIWFGAAFQKLRFSGFDWIFTNHVNLYLEEKTFLFTDFFVRSGLALTLFAELFSPFIYVRRLKWWLLFALFLFQIITIYSIKIPIYLWLATFVFWIEDEEFDKTLTYWASRFEKA